MIPKMVASFQFANRWLANRFVGAGTGMGPEVYSILTGSVTQWKGKRYRTQGERLGAKASIPAETQPALTVNAIPESIGEQLEHLRIESDITQLRLSELVNLDLRTIQRHLAGTTQPSNRVISRYEKQFSILLQRQILLRKLP